MISSSTRFRSQLEIGRQQRLAQDIARAQTEISSGKRIQAPSDDPVGASRVAQIGRSQAEGTVWKRNVETAGALASRADTALGSVATVLDRAKELMLTATNGTSSAENRATIAIELRSIAEEIRSLAAAKDFRGAPLFSAGDALAIPVGEGISVAPVDTARNIFGSIATRTGDADLEVIILTAADAITRADPAVRSTMGKDSLDAIDAASTHVATKRSEQGLRAERLDTIRERLEDTGVKMVEERSGIESTNVVEAIARIRSREVTLEAAQAIYSQLNQSTLFDMLR